MASQQQTRLFDKLAADLSTCEAAPTEDVICPLCAKRFGRVALDDPGPEGLSVEHIIPSALDGKGVTLTCRRCNNEQGSSHDAHVVRMLEARDWANGDGSQLLGKLVTDDGKFPLKVVWSDGTTPTQMVITGGDPAKLHHYTEKLQAMKAGDSLQFSLSMNYNKLNAERGLLRIAYLALFNAFGYQYILRAAGEKLRQLIGNGTLEDLQPFMLSVRDPQECEGARPVTLIPLRQESTVPGIIVLLRLVTTQRRYLPVLMPGDTLLNDGDFGPKLDQIKLKLDALGRDATA